MTSGYAPLSTSLQMPSPVSRWDENKSGTMQVGDEVTGGSKSLGTLYLSLSLLFPSSFVSSCFFYFLDILFLLNLFNCKLH